MTDVNEIMVTLMFTNGYCPFCKEDLAEYRSVDKYRLPDLDAIVKHIRDRKESKRWKFGISTLKHLSGVKE